MKTLLILLLLNLTLFGAKIDDFAEEMSFERDYSSALSKAKKENKLLVMVLSSDYCPWCRKFEHKTLQSGIVKKTLYSNFIGLIVDKKYDEKSYPPRFKTHYTPAVYLINPQDESVLKESIGYTKKKEFLHILNESNELFKSTLQ